MTAATWWKSLLGSGFLATLIILLFHKATLYGHQMTAISVSQGLCTIEEYNTGTWHPRVSPIATMQDILDLYGTNSEPTFSRDTECHLPVDASIDEEPMQRLLNVSSYEWKPKSQCSLHGYTRAMFLTYLLRAPGGLMIMGDSLTDQHMTSLSSLLVYRNGPVHSDPVEGNWVHATLHLDISHPDAFRILTAAGVPVERATQPLVTFNRDDLLIPHAELDQLYRDIGVTVAADLPALPAGTDHPDGIFRLSQWASSYPDSLEDIRTAASGVLLNPDNTSLATDANWPSGVRKEKTILLISTGAHWNPQLQGQVKESEVLEAYRNMIDKMMPRLLSLRPHVLVIWRAISPGHERCQDTRLPDPRRATLANPDAERNPASGHFENYWDMIEMHNLAVRQAVAKTKGQVVWMDGYSLAAQRPDVHMKPGHDCLHLCGTIIERQWTKLLWHTIQTHKAN